MSLRAASFTRHHIEPSVKDQAQHLGPTEVEAHPMLCFFLCVHTFPIRGRYLIQASRMIEFVGSLKLPNGLEPSWLVVFAAWMHQRCSRPVSYTHLTLPTSDLV